MQTNMPRAEQSIARSVTRAAILFPYTTAATFCLPRGKISLRPVVPRAIHTQLEHKGANQAMPEDLAQYAHKSATAKPLGFALTHAACLASYVARSSTSVPEKRPGTDRIAISITRGARCTRHALDGEPTLQLAPQARWVSFSLNITQKDCTCVIAF